MKKFHTVNTKNNKIKVMFTRNKSQNNKKRKSQYDNKYHNNLNDTKDTNLNEHDSSQNNYKNNTLLQIFHYRTILKQNNKTLINNHNSSSDNSQINQKKLCKQRLEETRIYGENSCQAIFKNRSNAIVRAWFLQPVTPRFSNTLKWMAVNRKAYHVVALEEMNKVSGTKHHGGVCFIIKKRNSIDAKTYLQQASATDCVLALEDITNPHNLGGIIRSCAHFNVEGVILQDTVMLESGAAMRTAEGGSEYIKAINADGFNITLNQFHHAGYIIVTTSSYKGTQDIATAILPKKMVLIVGQEHNGVSNNLWNKGNLSIYISGTKKVESLNVSVATGIILAKWWQQNKAK
ncbi:putative tRNA/rRNA methyltransferase YfiF [Candidatus Hartigia pinicola]|nr:putative tRNA/rRNA methyltransferase YfiF [Candidatus Hartigia pinicola]